MVSVCADHPRSRGVYLPSPFATTEYQGSSPLARGLLNPALDALPAFGIIPARAGFTSGWTCPTCGIWDHPRSRGVYSTRTACSVRPRGSSPLARGLRVIDVLQRLLERIIPARAGFTRPAQSPTRRTRDHPRSRGVYAAGSGPPASPPGSSPLARGLRTPYQASG